MVITDLKKTCRRCNGQGITAGMNNLGIRQINFAGECPECKGIGFNLTELGQDVVNMLQPFIERKIRAVLEQDGLIRIAEEEEDEDDQESDNPRWP